MRYVQTSNKIYIAQSTIPQAGRGVFAKVSIHKHEVIEICPVIELSEIDSVRIQQTTLRNYYFTWGEHSDKAAIGLGFSSLYNHSHDKVNAMYTKDLNEKTITYTAIEDIHKDQEIFVVYMFMNSEEKNSFGIDVP